jgi:hypothetical protein
MQPPQDALLVITGITAGADGEQIQIRRKNQESQRRRRTPADPD